MTLITAAYLAGRHHLLPHSSIAFTMAAEVAANLRTLLLFVLIAVQFYMVGMACMKVGFRFRWRGPALVLALVIGMLEIIEPRFFDLYRWITSAFVVILFGGIVFLAVCDALQRNPRLKNWFSVRDGVFDLKMEAAKTLRELELSAEASLVADVLLIACTLLPLAYWAGEAHAMKLMHLWG